MIFIPECLGIHQVEDPFLSSYCQQIVVAVCEPHWTGTGNVQIKSIDVPPVEWSKVIQQSEIAYRDGQYRISILLSGGIKGAVAGGGIDSPVFSNGYSSSAPASRSSTEISEQVPSDRTRRISNIHGINSQQIAAARLRHCSIENA